ncbi:hypothetical protein J4442_03295 [Candidatus Woesearchaeota archaeon]|nr:hypothetical protein [Candidatus Woesearchaeota archaeon]
MATTIQVSNELRGELSKRKLFDKESYEDVIWGLIEDTMELNEETKKHIKQAEEDIRNGRVYTHDEIKKKFGL